MLKIAKYVFLDIIRNRVIIAYTIFLLLVTVALFQLEEDSSKAVLSLMNVILIVVPLISIVFSTIHYYNSYEFIELMLSQPVSRTKIIVSEFAGIACSLITAFLIGTGIPIMIYQPDSTGISLILSGALLTTIFCSIAFLVSVKARDKARGIGIALMLWFYLALIYDGLILLILFSFSDYPVEKLTILLSSLNSIDLARIFMMLKTDVSALMGYTGATYKEFFGSNVGAIYTTVILICWFVLPFLISVSAFRKKDM